MTSSRKGNGASLSAISTHKITKAGNALTPRRINVVPELGSELLVFDTVPPLEGRRAFPGDSGGGCGCGRGPQQRGKGSSAAGVRGTGFASLMCALGECFQSP